jgi:hypothetical protein
MYIRNFIQIHRIGNGQFFYPAKKRIGTRYRIIRYVFKRLAQMGLNIFRTVPAAEKIY